MRAPIISAGAAPLTAVLAFVLALLSSIPAAGQTAGPDERQLADPFLRRGWHLELGTHGALETWNYNLSHEEMLCAYTGITYGVGKGVVLKIGSPLYYVWQRGTDGWLLGLTWGARGGIVRRTRWSVFWEFEVGISEADTQVPPRGTRFNYLALGGSGVAFRLRPGLHAVGSLRWVHVSNNGRAGRDRNPDIEAVGPALGVLLAF